MVLLTTVGLLALSLMNHPNPLSRMYTSPTHQYFLFTRISCPTRTYSLPLTTLKWALLVGLLPMSVSHGLRPVSHHFAFDGTLTTLLRSFDPTFPSVRRRIIVYFFNPLVHTARSILPDIPVMSTYPHFNYSYLLYQYLPTSTYNCRHPVL